MIKIDKIDKLIAALKRYPDANVYVIIKRQRGGYKKIIKSAELVIPKMFHPKATVNSSMITVSVKDKYGIVSDVMLNIWYTKLEDVIKNTAIHKISIENRD